MLGTDTTAISEGQSENSQKNLVLQRRLLYYAHHPQFISHRLQQLDRETSQEKIIENSSVGLSVTGILLAFANRRWLILSLLASGLFFLKNVSKSNQLSQLLQEQGYRSEKEIYQERQILLALRGDYDAIGAVRSITRRSGSSDCK